MLALFVLVVVVVASTSHRAVRSGATVVHGESCTHLAAIAWGRGPTDKPLCFSRKLTVFSSGLQT